MDGNRGDNDIFLSNQKHHHNHSQQPLTKEEEEKASPSVSAAAVVPQKHQLEEECRNAILALDLNLE